jgi:hypothetical protein
MRVTWSQGSYVDANVFHTMMEKDPKLALAYSREALNVIRQGTRLPNLLSNHSVIVFGEPTDRRILMCHRSGGTRPGGYTHNCWSVSCEEQYNPVKQKIRDRYIPEDHSIVSCIRRGVL